MMDITWKGPNMRQPKWQRDFWELALGDPISAIVSAGSSIIGSVISSNAQEDAAQTQADAADRANAGIDARYQQIRNDLQPFRDEGVTALSGLNSLGAPIDPAKLQELTAKYPVQWDGSQAALEATPGYQFTREQGLKAVENSASARGQGISGNQLRAAGEYSTGLANQTYGDQYNRYLQGMGAYLGQNQQIFNMLLGANSQGFNQLLARAQLGSNAAAQTGSFGTTAAGQVGANTVGAGNALAAGTVGSANALAGGVQGLGNAYAQYSIFNRLFPGTNPNDPSVGSSPPIQGNYLMPDSGYYASGAYAP